MSEQSRTGGFRSWLDERSGLVSFWRSVFSVEYRSGAGWYYIFGATLLFTVITQIITGVLLVFHYLPHPEHAYDSVNYIQRELVFGNIVRGLHHWGASAIVILLGLHFLRVLIFGAYKKPRELNWWTGLLLMAIVIGLAFTGYTLPWDQKGYWGVNIAISMMEEVPIIGPPLADIVLGGQTIGINTITQLAAIHTTLLPALLIIVLIIHFAAFRKQGPTQGWWKSESINHAVSYSPNQLIRDALLFFIVFALIFALALSAPPLLQNKADPTAATQDAKPEWFFLWIYYGMRFVEGSWAIVLELLAPALLALFFIILPILDRGSEKNLAKRWAYLVLPAILVLAVAVLTTLALIEKSESGAEATRVQESAVRIPTPEEEPANVAWARETFARICSGCHGLDGRGAFEGPPVFNREFFAREEKEELSESVLNGKGMMPSFRDRFDGDQIVMLVEFLISEFGNR